MHKINTMRSSLLTLRRSPTSVESALCCSFGTRSTPFLPLKAAFFMRWAGRATPECPGWPGQSSERCAGQ